MPAATAIRSVLSRGSVPGEPVGAGDLGGLPRGSERTTPTDTVVVPAGKGEVVSHRELSERFADAAGETSAPAAGGKTFLLRSWISTTGLADRTRAYIPRCENPVVREDRDERGAMTRPERSQLDLPQSAT